jgi:hypothetical protein
VPALGDRGIADLNEEDLKKFRQSHRVNGRKAAKGTIGQINAAWLEIVRDAIALGYLSKLTTKRLVISNEGSPMVRADQRSAARECRRSATT